MSGNRLSHYLILLAGLVFYLSTIRPGQRAGDFSMYLQHAVNIVEGQPYAASTYEQNPDAISVGTQSYPPGTPVILAPLYAVFGLNLVPMKAAMILFFFVGLAVFGMTTRPRLTAPFFALMLFDLSFTPYFWDFKENLQSDYLFLAPLFIALWLLSRDDWWPEPDDRVSQIRKGLLLGLVIYIGMAIRTIGLALLPALLVFDLVNSRRLVPTLRFWVPMATVAVLMVIQGFLLPLEDGTYGAAFIRQAGDPGRFIGAMILNVKYYLLAVIGRTLMSNGQGTLWADAMLILSLTPFAIGFWYRLRRDRSILEAFTVVYAGILLVWPFRQANYLIPLIPLLAYYLFSGIEHLVRSRPRRQRLLAAGGVFLLLAATYVPRYATMSFERVSHDVMSEASMEFYDYVSTRLGEDDGLITRLPREVALFTGLRTTPARHPLVDDWHYQPDEVDLILAHADSAGFEFIAAGPRGYEFHEEILALWNLLDERPELFEEVWANEEWRVVKVSKSSGR